MEHGALDTVATVVLFVVLTPASLAVATLIGAHMLMLGDGAPKSRVSIVAVCTAVVAPTLGTLALHVGGVVWACTAAGTTFHLPLVATAASAVWTVGVTGAAAGVVDRFR